MVDSCKHPAISISIGNESIQTLYNCLRFHQHICLPTLRIHRMDIHSLVSSRHDPGIQHNQFYQNVFPRPNVDYEMQEVRDGRLA